MPTRTAQRRWNSRDVCLHSRKKSRQSTEKRRSRVSSPVRGRYEMYRSNSLKHGRVADLLQDVPTRELVAVIFRSRRAEVTKPCLAAAPDWLSIPFNTCCACTSRHSQDAKSKLLPLRRSLTKRASTMDTRSTCLPS